jgi:catechol 2,3-dioxygenase-like lactoylglutathione lyase family enzyme
MITQIAHICLESVDLKASEKFYCETLGLEKSFEFVRGDEPYGLYLKAGRNTFIEIFKSEAAAKQGSIKHLCLETDQIDQVYQMLKKHGCEVTEKKLGCDKTWQIWTQDPDGVKIEIHEYTVESRQFKGGKVNVDF